MQPTARSTSSPSSASSTAPTEWQRSQRISAPAAMGELAVIAGHVGDAARAEIDVAERDQRHALVECGLDRLKRDARVGFRLDPADLEAALGRDPIDDEAVAGEVLRVGDDHVAPRTRVDGGPDQLVEQHRRRVADHRLSGRGPQADAARSCRRARSARPSNPRPRRGSGGLPRRPATKSLRRSAVAAQRPAQRVSIEVGDHTVGLEELVPERGEGIRAVQRDRAERATARAR